MCNHCYRWIWFKTKSPPFLIVLFWLKCEAIIFCYQLHMCLSAYVWYEHKWLHHVFFCFSAPDFEFQVKSQTNRPVNYVVDYKHSEWIACIYVKFIYMHTLSFMCIDSDISVHICQCYAQPTLCLAEAGFAVVDSLCMLVKLFFINLKHKNVMSIHAHMGDVSNLVPLYMISSTYIMVITWCSTNIYYGGHVMQ